MKKDLIKKLLPGVAAVVAVALMLYGVVYVVKNVLPDPPSSETITTFEQSEVAMVTQIKPIAIDCRAYIAARVPAVGESKTTWDLVVGDLTVNTDTISLVAAGDVDACVPPEASLIDPVPDANGNITQVNVTIDNTQVVFNRPRVDHLSPDTTAPNYNRGFGRALMTAFPFLGVLLNDNADTMTAQAYGFAQSIIGSSSCMKAAWPEVQKAIEIAYQDQAAAKPNPDGSVPKVSVEFVGVPNYAQYSETIDTSLFGDNVKFFSDESDALCVAADGALQIPSDTVVG